MNKQTLYSLGKTGLWVLGILLIFSFLSLPVFLAVCLFVVLRMAFRDFAVEQGTPREQKSRLATQRVWHYLNIGLVGLAASITLYHYYVAPERIFKNADHHVMGHLGYEFGRSLTLVNEIQPQRALWDQKSGQLEIKAASSESPFALEGKRFFEPVYSRHGDRYTLVTPAVEKAFDSTLTVAFDRGRRVTLWVHQANSKDVSYQYQYSEGDTSYLPLPINLSRIIRTGISLRDLLSLNPDPAPGFAEVLALLEGTYLLRQEYLIDGNEENNLSPLRLFPSQTLADSAVSVTMDGGPIRLDRQYAFTLPLKPGQSFYTGLRTKRTKTYSLRHEGGRAALYLGFPERHYLRSSESPGETLFLTSSGEQVANTTLTSGLLFDGPKREENYNHLTANLSYLTGPTTEKMRFRVVNEVPAKDLDMETAQTMQAGDTLRLATNGASIQSGHDVRWLMTITDLKATNGLPLWALLGFAFGFTALALLSVALTPLEHIRNSFKVEVAAYMVLLAFLVVRTVLLWRAATFVPVEDITPTEFDTLRNLGAYFLYQTYFAAGFFALILGYKIVVFHLPGLSSKRPGWRWTKARWLPWMCFLLYPLVGLKGVGSLERIVSVLVPVGTYFLIDYLFQRRAARQYGYPVKSPEYRFVRKFNWLVAMGAFALGDAGFAIVFLVFTLLYWYLRQETFPDHRLKGFLPKNGVLRELSHYRLVLVPVALLAFIGLSPQILSFVFRHLLLSVSLGLLFMAVLVWRESYLSRWIKVSVIIGCVLSIGLAYFFQPKLEEIAQSKNRMLYRAEVRYRSADDIIAAERFNVGNDRRLLNAAQNQWFINYYFDKGEFGLYRYLKLVPHFQQGSSYLTQISDLVSVRYVIAEHSEWVLIGLIILLGVLIFLAIRNQMPFHSATILRAQLLCFLFALSFTIWLTASDRMVFVGQDFPFLSMNSKLTLLVGFGILLLVVLTGYGKPSVAEAQVSHPVFEVHGSRQFLYRSIVLVVLFAAASYFLTNRNVKNFDLNRTVARLEQTFEGLNAEFELYQREVSQDQKPTAKPSPTDLVNGFDAYLQKEAPDFFKGKVFERSAYDAFRTRFVRLNSPGNLVHLRKNQEGLYEFAVNGFFYNVNSPDVYREAWKGHLTSASVHKTLSVGSLANETRNFTIDTHKAIPDLNRLLTTQNLLPGNDNFNLHLSLVPASWTKDSLPVLLLGRTQGEERKTRSDFLIKNGTEQLSSTHIRHAVALRPNDILHIQPLTAQGKKSRIVSLKISQKSEVYLAKNSWINGSPRHYYPLGERSLWSYYFTNLVKSSYDARPEFWNKNVETTLDPVLNRQIYGRVESYFKPGRKDNKKRGFSLVVLDSDGRIRALSDFKTDPDLRLDPNRMNDYKALLEELYLDPSSHNERQLFGNRCLIRMPSGPASTFKPILYGAITSQYDLGWSNLTYGGIGNYPRQPSQKDWLIQHFGGRKMKLILGADNLGEHDNLYYLSHSTNSYNSMMVYLGSLTPGQIATVQEGFRNRQPSGFLVPGANTSRPEFNFPLVKYQDQLYRVDKMPDWDEKSSLLARGLSENFKLPLSDNAERDVQAAHNRNLAWGLDDPLFNSSRSSYKLWSFPEASHLFLIDRKENMQNAIPQIAMGAYPITVTPLKIAEMTASLFSFNANTHATVLTHQPAQGAPYFSVGKTWGQESRLLSFYSNNLFKAMHLAVEEGTAQFIRGSNTKGYPLYAKTGTISGDRSAGDSRDKNLLVVISQNELHDRTLTANDLRTNKFYVLYFSFYSDASEGGWSEAARQTVRDLMVYVQNSDDFKNFMKKQR